MSKLRRFQTPARTSRILRGCALLLVIVLAGSRANASDSPSTATNDSELSLEQLINIKVTSVAKKETTIEESPAAITVVTPEEIQEFGITTLPDALRLVPGMDVAQINSGEWAVSARGFNSEFCG